MNMIFYWAKSVALLFDSWKTNPIFAMAIIFIFSALVGVFKYLTDSLIRTKLLDPLLKSKLRYGGKLSKFLGAIAFLVNCAVAYMIGLAFGYFMNKSWSASFVDNPGADSVFYPLHFYVKCIVFYTASCCWLFVWNLTYTLYFSTPFCKLIFESLKN